MCLNIERKTLHNMSGSRRTAVERMLRHYIDKMDKYTRRPYLNMLDKLERTPEGGTLEFIGGECDLARNGFRHLAALHPGNRDLRMLCDRMELSRKQYTAKYGCVSADANSGHNA